MGELGTGTLNPVIVSSCSRDRENLNSPPMGLEKEVRKGDARSMQLSFSQGGRGIERKGEREEVRKREMVQLP